jgi:hypothetical protein
MANKLFDYMVGPSINKMYGNLDFVKRINNPQNSPLPIVGKDGQYHTHLMSAEYNPITKNAMAFPMVANIDGNLHQFKDIGMARDYALKNNEYIPFRTIEEADNYSRNYKTPEFNQYYGLLNRLGK